MLSHGITDVPAAESLPLDEGSMIAPQDWARCMKAGVVSGQAREKEDGPETLGNPRCSATAVGLREGNRSEGRWRRGGWRAPDEH